MLFVKGGGATKENIRILVCASWCTPLFFSTVVMRFMRTQKKERYIPVKHLCKCDLRDYMADCLAKARKHERLFQAKFSERLMMDVRSYASLEHGESLCCTLTFIIYLCFFCKDVDALVRDLRNILLKAQNGERPAS